jgi:hypothetical protein
VEIIPKIPPISHTTNLNLTKECDCMKKFEYKVISVPRAIPIGAKGYEKMVTEFETNLNKLGAEGWELVQRADDFLFFKRELYVE